jgi:putative acetyltransferase
MLAADGDLLVSLVAEGEDGEMTGHVAFSWMHVLANDKLWRCAALAPLGVRTDLQRGGIGCALVEAGLAWLRQYHWQAVFVLGDPGYYRRFGFDAARAAPFASPYTGPHLMALYLDSALAIPQSGSAAHACAFARLEQP